MSISKLLKQRATPTSPAYKLIVLLIQMFIGVPIKILLQVSDMFLQVFFFATNVIGWWRWANPRKGEENHKHELKVSYAPTKQLIALSTVGLVGTAMMGAFASRLHEIIPSVFSKPSAFPYLDSFVTVMSIITTFLMIEKKVECWILWIVIDVVATGMYFAKGIKFLGLEYLAFCFIAAFGLWNWIREYNLNKSLP